jgi:hypothetical protein
VRLQLFVQQSRPIILFLLLSAENKSAQIRQQKDVRIDWRSKADDIASSLPFHSNTYGRTGLSALVEYINYIFVVLAVTHAWQPALICGEHCHPPFNDMSALYKCEHCRLQGELVLANDLRFLYVSKRNWKIVPLDDEKHIH